MTSLVGTFWSSDTSLFIVLAVCFLAVFALVSMLAGVSARLKRERVLAKRMGGGAGGSPGQEMEVDARWIPSSFAEAGQKVAVATGLSATLDTRLEQAGLPIEAGEFVALIALCAVLGAVFGALLLQNILFVLLIAAMAGIIPIYWLQRSMRKRKGKMVDQLADTLSILASSLRAGYSFLQALDTVSKEIGEPSATEFQRVVAEIRLGRPIDDALMAMAERVESDDLKWAVIAINVQRQVGGNLAEVLDIVSNTVRERAYIRRQVMVLSAEGRFSVAILATLPFLILIYMVIVNPTYVRPLFTTVPGYVLLAVGGSMMSLGIFVMTRMIKIDV